MAEALTSNSISQPEIERKVIEAVASALDLEPDEVSLSDSLQNDLQAESLDLLDIAFTLEREFTVHFPRADLLQRASEHFGEDALVVDGQVTELGLNLLKKGVPEIDAERFRPGLKASEVAGMFTVQTFVRILTRLLEAKEEMDKTCPECSGQCAESSTAPEFVCSSCGHTLPLPSGDEVLLRDLLALESRLEA
jgi:acyl carrier protein